MSSLANAFNLLPSTIQDDRGKYFLDIVWWMCADLNEIDTATIPATLIPYKLSQFGLDAIAGRASRLSILSQRQLLLESKQIVALAGTPWAIKHVLELFEYTGVVLNENPTINSIKRWGEFEVVTQQPFRYAEVEAIVKLLKPASRKLITIRNANALTLNGTALLDSTTLLDGIPGDETPSSWLDPTTALIPNPGSTAIPQLLTTDSNLASNFNAQLQGIINRVRLEDNALIAVANRISALNTSIATLGGGSIQPQLNAINSNVSNLSNSNSLLLTKLSTVTPLVTGLTTKANTLTSQSATIVTASNARQLDTTVQRRDADLDSIAALATSAPFPTNQVIATGADNSIAWQNTPALGAYIPQVCSLVFKQPAGNNAGNYSTANTWAAMPFSVESNDDNFVGVVSSSRFSIPSGTYIIFYQFQGCGCLGFGAKIWNVTDNAPIEQGSPGLTATGGGNVGDTWSAGGMLIAGFTITATKNIEFQFIAKALHPNGAALTAGQSSANAIDQVYQEVVIMKISN